MSITRLPRELGIVLRCDGTDTTKCEAKLMTGNILAKVNRKSAMGGGLGSGTSEGQAPARLLPGAHGDRTRAVRETTGGLGSGDRTPRRAEESEGLGGAAAEEAAQQEGIGQRDLKPDNLTLGGFRPGTGYALDPRKNQLWWRPCLKRAEDSMRERCWFLAPTTNHPSLYCWSCRSERGS